jgi:hypothetical protein
MSATVDTVLDAARRLDARFAGTVDAEFETELAAMQAIRDGVIPSPQRYANVLLVALRITGTGASYRDAHDEYVWRDPSLYLNDEFLARCNGLPVLMGHPEGNVLDSAEFAQRIVGVIALPFVRDSEVWGIAKIYDDNAAKLLAMEKLSTSPAVVFRSADDNAKITTDGGDTVLIEGRPMLLDHVCITPNGVWDKAGAAALGVDNHFTRGDSTMTAIERLEREVRELQQHIGPDHRSADRAKFIAARDRADAVVRAYGDAEGAPPPVAGERLLDYRARLLAPFQKYSERFKTVNLAKIQDAIAFGSLENEIYADAMKALRSGVDVPAGGLRAIITRDATGLARFKEYVASDPGACWNQFKRPTQFVRAWRNPETGREMRVF